MLTAVDHIVAEVSDLSRAITAYRLLGFDVATPDPSGASAYIVFGDFYLQIRVGDAPGLSEVVLRSDDIESEVSRLGSAGVVTTEIVETPVDGEGGALRSRRASAQLATRVGFVEHHHHAAARLAYLGGAGAHPNTATALERTYVAVDSIDRDLPAFEKVFGIRAPEPEMGTVIMSMMSVFYFGDIGVAVAEPRGPGPTADALAAHGPGIFQVLFRVEQLSQAARVIADRGGPPPRRGTRLSGESALLNLPENACGAYVAMAGPD